ncbi:head-tail connector protein [Jannaschia seohaensis]|uniref:Putative phiE125 gp8 family phage protein n=1 Tax=Jannaschia seohaensis TaxID=475081 RepID=A0A2Y9ANZ8_9RHOB|nr:hypothetical protein [Jannaschia seohaensis]PWJ19148.1 putative phiE125 gp8 family phage protein [Jannaschia seohaensis]SSA45806.1 phage conserved hypothetical protein, phiE125 gp8 family [Jannaschia seohaensis]
MVLRVLETEALADAALPVAQLATHMRLAEGYALVPGQEDRLRLRLRAAIATIERRLGLILIAREVVLTGPGGAARIAVPVGPNAVLVSVEQELGGVTSAITGGVLRLEDTLGPVLELPKAPPETAQLRVILQAGFANWDAVPAELAQAVLAWGEALDLGEDAPKAAERLIAPWRAARIGARV